MAVQRTFSILKPDVTRRNLTGAVNQRIEAAGLSPHARMHLRRGVRFASFFSRVRKKA